MRPHPSFWQTDAAFPRAGKGFGKLPTEFGENYVSENMGRLAQDMKREVIAIIGRLKDPRLEGGLLTVTRLDVTPDLDVAKVYVSVMGRADGPKPAIEALNRAAGHVRTEVSKKMHIRKAPRFIFVEDDGAAYAAHINELLRSLNVNGEEEAQPADTEQTED